MRPAGRSPILFFLVCLVASVSIAGAQTTHYAVNDDGLEFQSFQNFELLCNFPLGRSGANFVPDFGDDSSVTPNNDYTVQSFDTLSWTQNDTYVLHLKEEERVGSPFQKLGKVLLEGIDSNQPVPDEDIASRGPMNLLGTFTEEELFADGGIDISSFVNSVLATDHGRYLFLRLRFEICSDNDSAIDIVRLHSGGSTNPDSTHIVQGGSVDPFPNKLYFPQFAEGLDALSSQLVLVNPSKTLAANARLILNLGNGDPMQVDLNGEAVNGVTQVSIAAGATLTLSTDGAGPLQRGSLTVCSDIPLIGVVLFEGSTLGFAGVGNAQPLRNAVLPILVDSESGIDTGIAAMGLGDASQVTLALVDGSGQQVSTSAPVDLASLGQDARFVSEFAWDPPVDLSKFDGSAVLTASADVAVVVILARPGQFATLPVVKQLLATPSGPDGR